MFKKTTVLLTVLSLFIALTLTACGNEIKPATSIDSQTDPEINSTIEKYVGYSLNNDWDNAKKYLTGEALLLMQSNIQNNKGIRAEDDLVMIKTNDIHTGKDFAIADIQIVTKNNDMKYNRYFRYTLTKTDNWKIAYIDQIEPPIGQEAKTDFDYDTLIKNYLSYIESKDYNNAMKLLVSPALENAQNSLITPENINMEVKFQNISTDMAYSANDTAFVKVRYDITTKTGDGQEKSSKLSYIFKLTKIDENWYISDIRIN